jgi:hypothetical protein
LGPNDKSALRVKRRLGLMSLEVNKMKDEDKTKEQLINEWQN